MAGPRRPQDRVDLADLKTSFRGAFPDGLEETSDTRAAEARFTDEGGAADTRDLPPDQAAAAADLQAGSARAAVALDPRRYRQVPVEVDGQRLTLGNGSVVIAAITSCTNTSNPTVMVGAGLLARNAVARGLTVAPTVKTSLAPGSRAVTDYLEKAGLMTPLETLGFDLVGYGCTTCIGNSRAARRGGGAGRRGRRPGGRRPCSRATATSRAASIPWPGPATSPARRWWSPSPWPAGSTST